MRRLKWAVLVACLVSCGAPYAGFTSFCDGFASAYCARQEACTQTASVSCAPQVSGSVCYCGMNAIANGAESYHSEKVQACLDAIAAAACSALSTDAPPAACSLVYGLASGVKPTCPIVLGGYDGGKD